MKILFIQPNYQEKTTNRLLDKRKLTNPPISLLSIARMVKDEHNIKVVDNNFDDWLKEFKKFKPDIVALSVITGGVIKDAINISKKIRELNPNIKIIWGGIHPSLMPQQTIKKNFIDILIIGEGESTFKELVYYLEKKENLDKVKGIIWKKNGKIIINKERKPIKNLDSLPLMPWDLIDLKRYFSYEASLYTSRGCPHRCAFCYQQRFHKRYWRGMSVDRIMEELEIVLKKIKIKKLKFHDDNITTNKSRLYELLDRLPKNLMLYIESRAQYIDEELLKRLKKFKDVQILIGVESGNEDMLKLLQKDETKDDFRRAFKLCHKYKIATSGSFMIGLPNETLDQMKETINFIKSLKPTKYTCCVYVPFPATPLYDYCVKNKLFVPPKSLEEWGTVSVGRGSKFNVSKVSSDKINKLRKQFGRLNLISYLKNRRWKDILFKGTLK